MNDYDKGYKKALEEVQDLLKHARPNVMGYTFDLPDSYYKWQEISEAVDKLANSPTRRSR